MGGMYYITMLVSVEQEDAIRSLFRDKHWTCWIKALSNKHLAVLKQSGFSDMFSLEATSESPDASDDLFKEIKIEINVDNDNDLSDNQTQSLNNTEHASKCDESFIKPENTSSPANDDADFSFNSSGNINSNSVNDSDDTMDYQYTMDNNMVNNKPKPDVKKTKVTNTKNNAKIIAPNPAFLMIYPTVSSQLLVSSGQPVGNIIQPVGNIIPPVGNILQSLGSTIQPVGNMIRPMGNNMQPIGSIVQSSGNLFQTGGSVTISQPIENMKQQSQNISQQEERKSKQVRHDTKTDSETDSAMSESETDAAKSDSETESDTGPKCSVCGESFMTKTALNKHFETVHVCLLDYGCKDCKASFKTQYELWNHRQVAHPSLETMTADQPEETNEPTNKYMDQMPVLKGYLKCPLCDNMYKRKKTLHQHMKTNHEGSRTYTCDVCGSVYKSYQAYTLHKKDSNHSSSVLKQGTFMCDSCGELLPGYDRLKNHEKTCKNGGKRPEVKKTVPCDECGALFETEYRVMVHKRAVHTLEPCTCEICGVTKKNRQRLAGHMMRHDPKNKKHSCDECSKAFFTAALLKQHKRVHTKEKPFQCPLCDYRCAAKCNLTKHTLAVHKTPLSALSEFPELSLPVESLPMNLMT